MTIPINPALIKNVTVVPPLPSATPMNLCKPPLDGAKVVSFQVKVYQAPVSLQNRNVFLCDLTQGSPSPPLQQVGSIFVDATDSLSDVTILFADTGYRVRIATGDSALIPAITGKQLPKFYVIFGDNQATTLGDTANIFVLNQFIPEFNSNNYIRSLIYGQMPNVIGNDVPQYVIPYVQMAGENKSGDIFSLSFGPVPFLVTATVLAGLQISVDILSASATKYVLYIIGQTSNITYFKMPFIGDGTLKTVKLLEIFNMNLLLRTAANAFGNDTLMVGIDNVTNITSGDYYINWQANAIF